ncbi:MAG: polysaccharide deacetylase family protein [Bacteroidota bacterium]|nr:polysaccharide deacetylase family protein [Bacteroidota bacterium]
MCKSENEASIHAMEKGVVNSASIMVPCAQFDEMAAYGRANAEADFGVHLTLTSEWNTYKWKPVLSADRVPSLVDENGFFHASSAAVNHHAHVQEVEKELRAQIEKYIASGLQPTHLDTHMTVAITNPEFLKIYLKLGREYRLPILLNDQLCKWFEIELRDHTTEKDFVLDGLFMANPYDHEKGLFEYYTQVLQNMPAGVNCMLVHTGFNNDEMKEITGGDIPYGSNWRQLDLDFFTSATCEQLIRDNDIRLITWKEIKQKLF